MELEIKGKTYPLKASFRFLETIEKKSRIKRNDVEMDLGLVFCVTQMQEGDMRCLRDILLALNAGQNPVLKETALEAWLEDDCPDIEALADEVLDFLSRANVCKKKLKTVLELETPKISA